MKPKEQFDVNIAAADHYIAMYRELRSLKGLGTRGRLNAANRYLLWLPRGAVVSSLSSLDAFVHQVVYSRLSRLLNDQNTPISDSLAELVVQVAPIRKPESAREALQFIRATDGVGLLAKRITEKILQFASFQSPEKVILAYSYLAVHDPFTLVANAWQGPNTSTADLKKRLARYVKRRNQIAHEGDLDTNHQARAITPDFASDCVSFIKGLVQRLDSET